ncbi:hypothetical protein WN944_021202 [Citrus x changshan-huyou]|uniref:Uncharacterized protein n=1 Tax=Citrus x changshan-huyou TaxID=2935761 RepID=A0AAP0R084_9ROSI
MEAALEALLFQRSFWSLLNPSFRYLNNNNFNNCKSATRRLRKKCSRNMPAFNIKPRGKQNDLKNARRADDTRISTFAAPTYVPARFFETKDIYSKISTDTNGCAAKQEFKYSSATASKWGLFNWVYDNPMLDIYSDASSDVVDI